MLMRKYLVPAWRRARRFSQGRRSAKLPSPVCSRAESGRRAQSQASPRRCPRRSRARGEGAGCRSFSRMMSSMRAFISWRRSLHSWHCAAGTPCVQSAACCGCGCCGGCMRCACGPTGAPESVLLLLCGCEAAACCSGAVGGRAGAAKAGCCRRCWMTASMSRLSRSSRESTKTPACGSAAAWAAGRTWNGWLAG